jgi:hypothetical protein
MVDKSRVPRVQCTGTAKSTGKRCTKTAILGGKVCRFHGGKAKQVVAKAEVRAEVMGWGLEDAHEDPSEVLLRLVSQSARRVQRYSALLGEAYQAAERLQSAIEDGDVTPHDGIEAGKQAGHGYETAKEDLDRIFKNGGVAALVGNTYGAVKDMGVYVTGEAIRGLAKLEAEERDRCGNLCRIAITAGLQAEVNEIMKQRGALLGLFIQAVFSDKRVALTPEQLAAARIVMEEQMQKELTP